MNSRRANARLNARHFETKEPCSVNRNAGRRRHRRQLITEVIANQLGLVAPNARLAQPSPCALIIDDRSNGVWTWLACVECMSGMIAIASSDCQGAVKSEQ